jgi:hypothetical protein
MPHMKPNKLLIILLVVLLATSVACEFGATAATEAPDLSQTATPDPNLPGPPAAATDAGMPSPTPGTPSQRMDEIIGVGDTLMMLMTSGYSIPEPGPTDIRHTYPDAEGDYLLYIWIDVLMGQASDVIGWRQEIAAANTDLGELVSARSMQANYENVTLVFVAQTPCSQCILNLPGGVAVDLTSDQGWNWNPDAGRPTALPLQIQGVSPSVVETLCLQIDISYPQLTEPPSLAIEDTAIILLETSGISVPEAGEDCEATLSLNLTGQAESDQYTSSQWTGTRECWTGVSLTGEASLATETETLATFPVTAIKEPATATMTCHTIEEAPWYFAWPHALLETLYTLWGPDILLPVVQVKESYLRTADDTWSIEAATALLAQAEPTEQIVQALILLLDSDQFLDRMHAAEALGAIGAEPGVVPALIEALDDSMQSVRDQVLQALITATGQNFGMDQSQWQAWWDNQ